MAEPKTRPTGASVAAFLQRIEDPVQRKDAKAVAAMYRKATGARAEMWGPSIVGYGRHIYRGSNGKGVEWPAAGFSPRAGTLVLYLMTARHRPLLQRLGKHRTGISCLYIKRLADVDLDVLRALIAESVERGQ